MRSHIMLTHGYHGKLVDRSAACQALFILEVFSIACMSHTPAESIGRAPVATRHVKAWKYQISLKWRAIKNDGTTQEDMGCQLECEFLLEQRIAWCVHPLIPWALKWRKLSRYRVLIRRVPIWYLWLFVRHFSTGNTRRRKRLGLETTYLIDQCLVACCVNLHVDSWDTVTSERQGKWVSRECFILWSQVFSNLICVMIVWLHRRDLRIVVVRTRCGRSRKSEPKISNLTQLYPRLPSYSLFEFLLDMSIFYALRYIYTWDNEK
jgi:hypothetical protein